MTVINFAFKQWFISEQLQYSQQYAFIISGCVLIRSDFFTYMLFTEGAVKATGVDLILSFMADLWNRAGHYIFILWFLSSFYRSSFFFPRIISTAAHWMYIILRHMMWS